MKISSWMISVVKLQQLMQIMKTGLVVVSFLLVACSKQPEYQKFSGNTMGTHYHITAQLPADVNANDLHQAIQAKLESINQSMSTWRSDSLISQYNRAAIGSEVVVDQDFIEVLTISRQVYQASNGAFNPSVGALVKLWGFGPNKPLERFDSAPSDDEIEQAKQFINFASIENQGLTLYKKAPIDLDFSAVAKGYGVDALAAILRAQGINNYMVEIGGEIATNGVNPKQQAWRIGIESPDNIKGQVLRAIQVNQAAMATSGDYRNFIQIDGKRFSHTIDPRTGKPITHQLASVTVLAENVALADAWATALTVVGKDEALKLAEQYHLPVYLIWHNETGFETAYSSLMKPYL